MDKLKKLLSQCKCGVHITVNGHRDHYQTAEQKLKEYDQLDLTDELDIDVRKIMEETDTIVEIHFYPRTPIGFYKVLHYDFDAALDEALECFDG